MNITKADLEKVKEFESEAISKLRDIIIINPANDKSAERIAGYMTGMASVLVFMAVGCLGKEEGLSKVSDCINRAIRSLPPDDIIKKLRESD